MVLLMNNGFVDIIGIFVAAVIGFIAYYKWTFKYWQRNNIPYLEPTIPFGTMGNPLSNLKSFADINKIQYDEVKAKGWKHAGLFGFALPMYMPMDTKIIRNIMTKDSDHFMDHGAYINEKDDPLSAHLFSLSGAKWKNLRIKITPTFTSGKMKTMFQTVVACGKQLQEYIDESCPKNEPINVKSVVSRFTTDIIGSCGFGLDCNSFKDPNSLFSKTLERNFMLTKTELLKNFVTFSFPNLSKYLRLTIIPKEVSTFVFKIVKEVVDYRENNNFRREDFLQTLIDLKNDKSQDAPLTFEEVSAQAFIFLLGGYETSSATLSFCLCELAYNSEIQQKLRDEINTVLSKHDGTVIYEAIMEMKYMGQVIDETLRKYPPLPVLNRKCGADYNIPDTDIVIEKDTVVSIPIYGMQHDKDYFPDPEKFDPERFNATNKDQIQPFTYMPFGAGPRMCIAFRFGLIQIKLGLCMLLQNYKFSLNEKTKFPLEFNPSSFMLAALGDIWLNIETVQEGQ